MSTISDVAKRAGVSAMTVSRVVRGTGYTSAATRSRVEAAIEELGYVPNALARQLRSKRTKMIALVVSDISNPFFTTIARGAEDVAVGHGFSVMYCNTDESEAEEEQYLLMLIERQVDGVLLVPARSSGTSFRLLQAHRMPVVVMDRRVAARDVDSVLCDSEAGAYALTRHLIELGHRRIAVLTGRHNVSTSVDRVAGCRRAIEEAGLTLDDELVRYGGFNFGKLNQTDGHRMAEEVLAAGGERPTAIFAANNFIAFGAIRALREAGLRVPEDMSIVAFDDLPEGWVVEPFLTVAAQPAYEIGRRAATLLLDHISGDHDATGESIVLPFELIIRRSSGPPRVMTPGAA
ncbi:MAG: LacI family DNA-binding transcriptional regulator [Candidatus Limnocylindrales bacterium]